MTTFQMTGAWNPAPRWSLQGTVYSRDLEQSAFDLSRRVWALGVEAGYRMEPGWAFSAGLGASRTDGEGDDGFTSWRIGATTPRRYPYGGSILVSAYPLDVTAQLVERGVRVETLDLSGRWTPAPGWQPGSSRG